jgi:hypothetical protein
MAEYFFLIFSSFIFLLFLIIPIRKIFLINFENCEKNIFDYSVSNLIIFSNLLLILSLLKINISSIVIINYFLFFLSSIFFYQNIIKKVLKFDNLLLFVSFFVILFILSVNIANNLTLGWDAQTTWFPRTINFYNDLIFTKIAQNARIPEYPFFGSLSWSFFWKFFSTNREYLGRIFYVVIFLLSIFSFVDLLNVSIIKKIFFSLILILLIYDYWHFRGFQEIIIFSFLLIISKYIYYIIFENKLKIEYLFIILITSNLIIWTKYEGIFFSLFVFILIFCFSNFSLKIKILNLFFLTLLIFARFFIYEINNIDIGLQNSLENTFDFKNIISVFFENFKIINLKIIFINLCYSIFKYPILLISFIFAIILCYSDIKFKKILFIYIYLLLNICFIFFVYLSTTYDLNFMVVTGLNRVFFESSALYLLFGLIYIKYKLKI